MFKQLSPCKDCKDRHMACWDGCEKYKEWKSAFEDNKQKYREDKQKRTELAEVKRSGYKNMTTRKATNKFK